MACWRGVGAACSIHQAAYSSPAASDSQGCSLASPWHSLICSGEQSLGSCLAISGFWQQHFFCSGISFVSLAKGYSLSLWLLVTLAEAGSRFQVSGHESLDSFQGRNVAVDHEGLDPVLVEIFGGTPSHAVTENGIAISLVSLEESKKRCRIRPIHVAFVVFVGLHPSWPRSP